MVVLDVGSRVDGATPGEITACVPGGLINSVKKEASGHPISPHMSAGLLTLARYFDREQVPQVL